MTALGLAQAMGPVSGICMIKPFPEDRMSRFSVGEL
jgi:hypothetical protein